MYNLEELIEIQDLINELERDIKYKMILLYLKETLSKSYQMSKNNSKLEKKLDEKNYLYELHNTRGIIIYKNKPEIDKETIKMFKRINGEKELVFFRDIERNEETILDYDKEGNVIYELIKRNNVTVSQRLLGYKDNNLFEFYYDYENIKTSYLNLVHNYDYYKIKDNKFNNNNISIAFYPYSDSIDNQLSVKIDGLYYDKNEYTNIVSSYLQNLKLTFINMFDLKNKVPNDFLDFNFMTKKIKKN